MRILKNRITLSLFAILFLTYWWEFKVKLVSGPIYTAAVSEYKNQNYSRSLELLKQAYRIDPNDAAILTLMGWSYLKLGEAQSAEPYFVRAHRLAPYVLDLRLGYAYTEVALKNYEQAAKLLKAFEQKGIDSADVRVAWATLYREVGRNRDAAREFQRALALQKNNAVAVKNLREIYNVTGDVREVSLDLRPLVRPQELTYSFRAEGDYLARRVDNDWKSVYLAGVDLTPTFPGRFPKDWVIDPAVYDDWLEKISALGANTIRAYTILPPAFYRELFRFNSAASKTPLLLIQGITFGDPPRSDFYDHEFYNSCLKRIRDTLDVIHGQADIGPTAVYAGGIYPNNVAPWVAGFLLGQTWLPHLVTENNQLHPDIRSYSGAYIEVPSGSPTEIFLAQMINYAAEYEENKYNWQHPAAFLSWSSLDPMRHPTESTFLEEVSIRRAKGERIPAPSGPYDDDDAVSLDPTHLRVRERYAAGYFAAYSVFPFYPDFINQDLRYQQARDGEGNNPFWGYLRDLKSYHRGMPLLVAGYGIPTSLGIGHFSPVGFNEGGIPERQQGQILARLTRNVIESGAAGGTVFEWLDQWFRQSWLQRNLESPPERRVFWTNIMDPASGYGLLSADPGRRSIHLLTGDPKEWNKSPPIYAEFPDKKFQAAGDRYDAACRLKALYADADEGFFYLRLVVDKLDNDNDGHSDWEEVNYLIGISTAPGQAGLEYLPFIAPVRFPMGMTYAVQVAGPETSRIWIASSYSPYQIVQVEGIPTETVLVPKLGWKPKVTDEGSFEPQVIEPNRRRYARDGRYSPPQRYDRGILRYGSLRPNDPDYDTLAEWHANIQTNTIDLRIPWNLLNVTDPSSFKVLAGIEKDGTVDDTETSGFWLVAFSYRPLDTSRARPMMEQGHSIADALPGMTGPETILAAGLRAYRWAAWNNPRFELRAKESYGILQRALLALPTSPPALGHPTSTIAWSGEKTGRIGRVRTGSRR